MIKILCLLVLHVHVQLHKFKEKSKKMDRLYVKNTYIPKRKRDTLLHDLVCSFMLTCMKARTEFSNAWGKYKIPQQSLYVGYYCTLYSCDTHYDIQTSCFSTDKIYIHGHTLITVCSCYGTCGLNLQIPRSIMLSFFPSLSRLP